MPGREAMLVAELQRTLDKGFRLCRALGEDMQKRIEADSSGRLELLYIGYESLKPTIRPLVNDFYKTMTRTLFEVLRLLQPDDFAGDNRVNFYFLPGYHSHLINKRIFYQESDGPDGNSYKSFGVGLCGGADGTAEEYHDCCHARWYHYATTPPRNQNKFLPASPYHWFAYQQPRVTADDPHDLVASLTFSTDPSVEPDDNFPEHMILNLATPAGSSSEWGTKVADMLNAMPHRTHPHWVFPDRGDREQVKDLSYDAECDERLRRIRCLLISLWMHSVFESRPPDWWRQLNEELERQSLTSVSESIAQALADEVACDWGDRNSGRPGFTNWTTINLHPLSPRP